MHRTFRLLNHIQVRHAMTSASAPAGQHPIQLYSLATPNGQKIGIALEEMGIKYDAHTINIGKNEQFQPWFLEISPNNRIPALVDKEGPGGKELALMESGAILIYLADKTGSDLLPKTGSERYEVLQWLMWQMGGLGPMLGQLGHFWRFAVQNKELTKENLVYGQKRYLDEGKRLFGVLEKQLKATGGQYVAGSQYSIADIAIWPWVNGILSSGEGPVQEAFHSGEYKTVQDWAKRISERPAVQKGILVTKLG